MSDACLHVRELDGNQLVAYNVAYWRRALGMTQEELAELMEHHSRRSWSGVKVSALERSIEGTRPALVPADELINLAKVLQVPLLGLFLPPVDDGTQVRYRLGGTAHQDFGPDMGELVDELLFPNGESRGANLSRYFERMAPRGPAWRTCLTCGALVDPNCGTTHDAWHDANDRPTA